MNVHDRQEQYKKIITFLTTPTGTDLNGKPIYPTIWDASVKFRYSVTHIFRIKKTFLGLDKDIKGRADRRKKSEAIAW